MPEEQSRGIQEQTVAEEVSTVDEEVSVAVRHGRMCTGKGLWLAKAQPTARVDVLGSMPASMHDHLCEVCDTILLSSLLQMFPIQTPSISVFSVVRLSCGIVCQF